MAIAMHEYSMLGTAQLNDYMRQAVALSLAEVERGGVPFSALVIHPQEGVLGFGVNRVLADGDSTAHAEIVALRAAAHRRGTDGLAGCALLASGEPCGMCYRGAFDAQISTILYAVGSDEAARYGFDYRASYRLLDRDRQRNDAVTIQRWPVDGCLIPLTTWTHRHP